MPVIVYAGIIDIFGTRAGAAYERPTAIASSSHYNSQTMPLLEAFNTDQEQSNTDDPITIVDGMALASDTGPGDDESVDKTHATNQISLYVVHKGDTLSEIADMFGVSVNTIRWANNLSSRASVSEGDKLTILPITGLRYAVKKGDTIKSIAKKYQADADEILQFNGLEDADELTVEMNIIIPNGEQSAPVAPKKSPTSKSSGGAPSYSGYYRRPINGGVRTQGIHGNNAVDLAAPTGSTIYAAAAGEVIISKDDGAWNGGYGSYIVIGHDNGTQTLYSHNSANYVHVGDTVTQGQAIGSVGMTGHATGPHVHFEVRGARNPF